MSHLKVLFLCLIVSLAHLPSAQADTEFYTEMPYYLNVTQETQQETVVEGAYILRTYPHTANDDVDRQMRLLIDAMAERNRSLLPLKKGSIPSYLDVGAVFTRSGTSVVNFLALAEVSHETRQLSADYAVRVYDIETGRLLSLTDFFDADSEAWDVLSLAVREQLSAAFPGIEPDAEALDRLCKKDSLQSAAFMAGGARLSLVYRADALYPGKHTLVHVHVYYPEIRAMMTDYGKRQTDNSRFPMIALTYDDGPARGTTRGVLNELRSHGALATFFIVGQNIARNHDTVSRQQNCGHAVQSHSYTHKYPWELKKGEAFLEDERLRRELGELTGVPPTIMRAPGGNDAYYTSLKMGYPMINWSAAAGDSGNDNLKGIINTVVNRAEHRAVMLMHDSHHHSRAYTAELLDHLVSKGFLCVTVEELFSAAGVPLEPDKIYFSPDRIAP